jgi:glucose-1-phosphate thymidylyltransferase
MIKNAILLTGGAGTRLLPFTTYLSKHLLNAGGKPVIDYPLNSLKQMGVENLTIVVGSSFSGQILDYVQDGSKFGMNVNYCYQPAPKGIAHAVSLCQRYVADDDQFVVLLGDNLFDGPINWNDDPHKNCAQILLKKVPDPERFGVASCKNGKICDLREKPKVFAPGYEHLAITGCYLFNNQFFKYFKETVPSARQEFEIVSVIQKYLDYGQLSYSVYEHYWHDLGTHDSIAHVNNYFFNKNNLT